MAFIRYPLGAVIFDSLPEVFAKKLPRDPEVPAALVGRLAVDLQHRNKLGETLLLDAMLRTLQSGRTAAVLVVDPKDEQAAR